MTAMDATLEILRTHAARYPLMQPTDAVKLLYQNEFGGGHLVTDEGASLARLEAEQRSLLPLAIPTPAFEEIGNGLVRVHLALLNADCTIEQLNRAFIRSSQLHSGSRERFIDKLNLLRLHREALGFRFSQEDLERYLADYAQSGYPMVSHSETYRSAYHPAYRVVMKSVLEGSKP